MFKERKYWVKILIVFLAIHLLLVFNVLSTSFEELKRKALSGDAKAQHNLGLEYIIGEGVPQDYKKAFYWYTKAANQGIVRAQHNLGTMYDNGYGVPQDYKKAFYWYTKAANQGHAMAQVKIGVMYAFGEGVPQNYLYAYAWYSLAAAQGYKKAFEFRYKYETKLTSQQLVKAQELAIKIQYKIDNLKKESDISRADKLTPHRPKIKSSGTGFIITRDGYIVTCHHVVHGGSSIKIRLAGKDYTAKLVREDKYNDLALLKISGTFSALAFSSKRSAKMGQDVFSIGFPSPLLQGINAKLTKGAVNSLTGFQDDLRMYQISVPVQPGNSGGPLLDLSGNVVGVIVAALDAKAVFKITGNIPQNVNYSIKHSYAQAMIDTFPEVSNKLPSPYKKQPFNDMVNRVQKSVVLVLVYE